MLAFLFSKFVYTRIAVRSFASPPNNMHLIPFLVVFAVLMLLGLHGLSIFKIILILGMNYRIAKLGRGQRWAPLASWVFNGLVLFANERYDGYPFALLHPSLAPLVRF